MIRASSLTLAVLSLLPLSALAQPEGAAGLSDPARPAAPPGGGSEGTEEGTERVLATDPGAGEIRDEEWTGPRVEMGYGTFNLGDGFGGGQVHAFEFGGYVPPLVPFRLAGYAEMGVRDYALGQSDVLLRTALVVGYQQARGLGRFVPFVGAVGTVGTMLGKRFHRSVRQSFRGLGLEAGADVALVRTLWMGVAVGYLRAALGDVSFHLLVVRLRIGL